MYMSVREVDVIAGELIHRNRFIVKPPLNLHWLGPVDESVFWEMYQGRALDYTMTRQRKSFRVWNVFVDWADEPLISIKFDTDSQFIHVTRAVLCHAHAISSGAGKVIEVAKSTRWIRELVGTMLPSPQLREELSDLLFRAVVGTGRLPLTSLEAPLPAFSFGQLGYFPVGDDPEVAAKRLEFSLRSGLPEAGDDATINRLKQVFLGVSLSPYTGFVSNVITYLRCLESDAVISPAQRIDFLCYLLRLQWRHLNAYDLITFHHRGTNYPDALLVDEVLREVLAIAGDKPQLFNAPLNQRGLRLGWILRLMYRDHMVPEQPTSPGENLRVLPDPFVHMPDEQIVNPLRRPRRLFDQPILMSPMAEQVLNECLKGLSRPDELRELGTALILDRPLGMGKSPYESDRTPLFSHLALSRMLAEKTIARLSNVVPKQFEMLSKADLSAIDFGGVPIPQLARPARPGVVAITDILRTASDFHVVSTTRSSLTQFRRCFDWSGLPAEWNDLAKWHVLLPAGDPQRHLLRIFNRQGVTWLELQIQTGKGFVMTDGFEAPSSGLIAKSQLDDREFLVLPARRPSTQQEPQS
jgi:hypothetical protein